MAKQKNKQVMIIAGEASADLHGSNLVRAMKGLDTGISFMGIGGKKMENAGVRILFSSSDMAVVGLTEPFLRLPFFFRVYSKCKSLLKRLRPDLLILIDYPEFNILLARHAKRMKVPVLYYISPQVWAWRRGRIKKIAARVDRMAVILPFEKALYHEQNLNVEYVGHPLVDSAPKKINRGGAIRDMGLSGSNPILGLLPGSRREEIKNHLPIMVKAAEALSFEFPGLKGILPLASTVPVDLVKPFVSETSVDIQIAEGDIYHSLAACDLALVTSGTATLETAIMEIPMIIVYRVSPISYWIGKRIVKVPFIGLVNLVAGEKAVPELIQDDLTPQRLALESRSILEGGQKKMDMLNKLRKVKKQLGMEGASKRTAQIAIEMMQG